MARKRAAGSTTSRSKKNGTTTPSAPVEIAAETDKPVRKSARKTAVVTPSLAVNCDIEEAIRRRAYELYLERAMAGGQGGNEGQDWLIAEREVRSRVEGQVRKPASFAATVGAGS
jgi:Protein of unknown function (DUF2934)